MEIYKTLYLLDSTVKIQFLVTNNLTIAFIYLPDLNRAMTLFNKLENNKINLNLK